jgi:hypothetical protein
MSKVVIWGLKNTRHSHKFIQNGFYINAQRMGMTAHWVDDKKSNREVINRGDFVFAVNVASTHLPVVQGAKYILHNISPDTIGIDRNFINLQVHVKESKGINTGLPYIHWDANARTLYQPWGVPSVPSEWLKNKTTNTNYEYWVGSIWNNELNQGNSEFMKGYIKTLKNMNIKFVKKGATSIVQPRGISESKASQLVNRSVIGAAVVGNWQRENQYIPCRLFKNIAAGAIPSSNSDFSELFSAGVGVFNENPEDLIQRILSISAVNKSIQNQEAQRNIQPYTYIEGMKRIFTALEN